MKIVKGGNMKLIEKIKEYINSKNKVVDDSENIKFLYRHKIGENKFEVDTAELKNVLGDISFSSPEV